MPRKFLILLSCMLIVAASGALWYSLRQNTDDADNTGPPAQVNNENPSNETAFDKTQFSLDDPDSPWVIVNKQRPLEPETYAPSDLVVPSVRLRVPGNESMQLRQPAATAVEEMFAAAQADGIELMLSSGYRSYTYQVNLYNSYVRSEGQAAADTQSARPGHSEHQTGLAVDIRPITGECELEACFGELPEGKWLAANAHRFGFVIRYTPTNKAEAGYVFEPWHFRYVGKELAGEVHTTQPSSLESFFGLPPAPDYN